MEPPARGNVQPGGRLVEHDQARTVDEGERELEALALAAGEGVKRGIRLVSTARTGRSARPPGRARGRKEAKNAERLAGCDLVLERGELDLGPHPLPGEAGMFRGVDPADLDRPGVRPAQAEEALEVWRSCRPRSARGSRRSARGRPRG